MVLELTSELEQSVQAFAAKAGRTPEDVLNEAVRDYIQHHHYLAEEVREGEESAEREGWLTQDEVFERLNARLQKIA